MSRIATPAGPGTARVPASHNCTARTVTSSARAISSRDLPNRSRIARNSSADTATPRRRRLGNQHSIEECTVRILDRILRQAADDLGSPGRAFTLTTKLPSIPPVHLDAKQCHLLNLLDNHCYTNIVRRCQA